MTPPPPPPPPQGWFGRNWKWFVPTGCATLLLLFVGFIAGILGIVATTTRSSYAYKEAMARAQADPRVIDKLGQPVRSGWFVSGSINTNPVSGEADLAIPISGPKGKGKLYVGAKKSAGRWRFETLEVEVEGLPGRIDLLQAAQ